MRKPGKNAWFDAKPAEMSVEPIRRATSAPSIANGGYAPDVVRNTNPGEIIPQEPRQQAERSPEEQAAIERSQRQALAKHQQVMDAVKQSWSK